MSQREYSEIYHAPLSVFFGLSESKKMAFLNMAPAFTKKALLSMIVKTGA